MSWGPDEPYQRKARGMIDPCHLLFGSHPYALMFLTARKPTKKNPQRSPYKIEAYDFHWFKDGGLNGYGLPQAEFVSTLCGGVMTWVGQFEHRMNCRGTRYLQHVDCPKCLVMIDEHLEAGTGGLYHAGIFDLNLPHIPSLPKTKIEPALFALYLEHQERLRNDRRKTRRDDGNEAAHVSGK